MALRSTTRKLAEMAGMGLAYFAAAQMALRLAIPPGYATAVWPSAGLALAGVLLLGDHVWPGILLGSFLVNVSTLFDATSTVSIVRSLALPSSVGVGAAVQAVLGGHLVRRFTSGRNPLDSETDLIKLVILGGPVSCVVNALCGSTSLLVLGAIPPSNYFYSWTTWWVGDTIGVLILTPLTLVWATWRGRVPWRQKLLVTPSLGLTFACALAFFVLASRWQCALIRKDFERRTDTLSDAVRTNVDRNFDALFSLRALFRSAGAVDRRQFHAFVQPLLQRQGGIQALEWTPRVPQSERDRVERAARCDGYANFHITERKAQGDMVPAAQRAEYFPVYYVEPYRGNESALGFDLASDPDRGAALKQARDSNSLTSTGPIVLVQEIKGQFGFVVVLPVYAPGKLHNNADERRESLLGFATGVFRVNDLMRASFRGAETEGLNVRLYEQTPKGRHLLYDSLRTVLAAESAAVDRSSTGQRDTLERATGFDVGGRWWTLRFDLPEQYLIAHKTWESWTVLAGGLLFTGVLGLLLLVLTGRATNFEELVAERTVELGRANKALRDSEEKFRALAETAHDAIVSADRGGNITYWNPGAERTFGYRASEVQGESLILLMPERFRQAHTDGMERYLATGEARIIGKAVEVAGRRKDGMEFPLELSLATHKTAEGTFFTGVLRDITERKQAEAQIAARTAELEAVNRELEAFTYSAAHDLRAPLRHLHAFAERLDKSARGKLDESGRRDLGKIIASAQRMGLLVDSLLRFSGVGRAAMNPCAVSVAQMVEEIRGELENELAGRRVTWKTGALPCVYADPTLLRVVLTNLLDNALKFTRAREESIIETGSRRENGMVTLFVRDNGAGFEMAYAGKLFQVFHRLHRDDEFEGTGIGLATVRRIIERHGGRVWAEGNVGNGATFYFSLPDTRGHP